MCFASLHVANRKATKTETLTIQKVPTYAGWKGLYSTVKDENQSLLICVVGQRKATLKTVRLEAGMPSPVAAWNGKRRVKVTLFNRSHNTWVQFPDGATAAIHSLKIGTLLNMGVPFEVKKRTPKAAPAGMTIIEQALDEASKTPAPAEKVDAS